MNTKIIIVATIAALSLATTAFAESQGGTAQGFPVPTAAFSAAAPLRDTGSQQYPAYDAGQGRTVFDDAVLPPLGQNGAAQAADAVPQRLVADDASPVDRAPLHSAA